MDFWSRLIAGTPLSPSTGNKAAFNNPDKRLARFKREHNQLIQVWRNSSNISQDQDAAEAVRGSIQELSSILNDETRRPLPHICVSFAASKQIYVSIGKIATTSYNEPIIQEAVKFFSTLIENEEEDFLENDAFSKSLMNLLVRITGANSIRLGSDTEVEVIELAFGIAAKIRLQPEILPAWFTTHEVASDETEDAHEKFAGKTHKEDFPLFYLLIDYIHHEGRVGDFARTGLLYIIESAATSVALEQWIVESDLATLMATGLGALYSQLSRKLVIDYPTDNLPSILALSDYQHPVTTMEIVSSTSPDFQGHMDTFLSHLVFWQDVLDHCKSVEVKQTLLEHFQVIFLQQLLYPSLLESSDIDGGSSVAVLTYLRRILESLEHPDMIHLILHYLLALPNTTPIRPSGPRGVSAARKRKSMDLATMMAAQAEVQSTPDLFNLVDLILGSLRSNGPQTVNVTLQLLSVILRRHHRYAVTTLLRTTRVLPGGPRRTIGAHNKELEFLLTLAGDICSDDSFDQTYEDHIKDTMSLLESHPCSHALIAPRAAKGAAKTHPSHASVTGGPQPVGPHSLRPDDPILKTMLNALETFFTNPVQTNLSLTEAIVDLGACGFMHLEGWLLTDPTKYTYEDTGENDYGEDDESTMVASFTKDSKAEEMAQLKRVRLARRTPVFSSASLPTLLLHLQSLVNQVSIYRTEVPRFDDLLQQRRETFKTASEPLEKLSITPNQTRISLDSSRSASPPPPSMQSAFDSLAQRIFPELATPSRSSSPRGRRSQDQQRSGVNGGGYGIGTPTALSRAGQVQKNIPPPQFPMGLETPMGGNSRAFSPSPLREGGVGSRSPAMQGRGSVGMASQAAAFAEVDKGILSRKIGMPSSKSTIKAVPFPDLRGKANSKEVAPNTSDSTKPVQVISKESAISRKGEDGQEEKGENADEDEGMQKEEEEEKLVTVSHVLTNVILLQEFLLELAALVQVRAALFGEVSFI